MKAKLWTYLIFPVLPILVAGCGNTPGRDIKGPTALPAAPTAQSAPSPSPGSSPVPSPSPAAPSTDVTAGAATSSAAAPTSAAPSSGAPSSAAPKVLVTMQMDSATAAQVTASADQTNQPTPIQVKTQNQRTPPTPVQAPAPSQTQQQAPATAQAQSQPPAQKPLLIVGDSHTCGTFGAELLEKIQVSGRPVYLFCAVSSQPTSWVEGVNPKGQICLTSSTVSPSLTPCGDGYGQIPKFKDILAAKNYGKVIVALGTNSLSTPDVDKNYGEMAHEIAAANVGTCSWIGPPHLQPTNAKDGFTKAGLTTMENNLTGFYASLTNAVGQECSVIDSRPSTAPGTAGNPTVDGVHRGAAAGAFWADSLFSK